MRGETVEETHPASYLMGWFTSSSSLTFLPTSAHVTAHQELLGYNESLVLLLLDLSCGRAEWRREAANCDIRGHRR